MNRYIHFLLFIFTSIFVSTNTGNGQSKFIDDSLDVYITHGMKLWNIPGLAITIVKDGKVIYRKGFGVREVDKPSKVDENTLFMIASNTKAFTATALALLDYEKRLSLDNKVNKYMPDFKLYDSLASREVTIRDLLCHRTGLGDGQGDFLFTESNYSRKEIIHKMRDLKPMYSFRSQFQYCNDGYIAAGEIVPLVTDTSWDDFIKYNIFKPLKMNSTTTRQADIINNNNAAKPYTIYDNKLVIDSYDSLDNAGPCGGIISNVKVISNWLIMQLDSGRFESKQIIPFDIIRRTRTSNIVDGDQADPMFPSLHFLTYGLGWRLNDYQGHKIAFHSGSVHGFSSLIVMVPEEKFGFSVMMNNDDGNFKFALRNQLLDALFNVPYRDFDGISYLRHISDKAQSDSIINKLKTLAASHPKPALDLKEYAGRYMNDAYGEVEIKAENGNLNIYFSHHPHVIGKLEPLGENMFACIFNPVSLGVKEIPFTIKDGKVQSVAIDIDDNNSPCEFNKVNKS